MTEGHVIAVLVRQCAVARSLSIVHSDSLSLSLSLSLCLFVYYQLVVVCHDRWPPTHKRARTQTVIIELALSSRLVVVIDTQHRASPCTDRAFTAARTMLVDCVTGAGGILHSFSFSTIAITQQSLIMSLYCLPVSSSMSTGCG